MYYVVFNFMGSKIDSGNGNEIGEQKGMQHDLSVRKSSAHTTK